MVTYWIIHAQKLDINLADVWIFLDTMQGPIFYIHPISIC